MSPAERRGLLVVVYGLFALIGLAALLTAVGLVPHALPAFQSWAVPTLLADISAVALLVFRTEFLDRDRRMLVNVEFEGKKPDRIDLDPPRCRYEVRDFDNKIKREGTPAVLQPDGESWRCQFAADSNASHANLQLVERDGTAWAVRNFSLTTQTVRARR